MKQVEITSKVVGRGESEGITSAIPSINLSGFALKSDLLTLEKKFSDFLNVPIIDGTINRWNELETFLAGISEDYNLLSLLNGKADKSYVDTNFVTIAGTEDVTGLHNFVNGLKIGGLPITKKQDDVIYIDANVVVRGGVTMYSEGEVDIPTLMDSIAVDSSMYNSGGVIGVNRATTSSVGVASFNPSNFTVDSNGMVSLTSAPSSGASTLGELLNVDDSIDATASVDRVLYQPAGSAMWTWRELPKDGVVGDYLPLTGGTVSGNVAIQQVEIGRANEINGTGYYLYLNYSHDSLLIMGCNSKPVVVDPKWSTNQGNTNIRDIVDTTTFAVVAPIHGLAYYKENDIAAFIFDKPGSCQTGIGANGEADTIYFGACDRWGNWQTHSQIWKFGGSIVCGALKIWDTNVIDGVGGSTVHLNYYGSSDVTFCKGGGTTIAFGNFLTYGGITMYSDIRKKTKLQDVELSLKQIADAPLIEHYYNSDQEKTTHVGSIAQYWASMNDWFCKLDAEGFYTMEIQNCALASAISIARHLERYESKTDKTIRKMKQRIQELEDEVERLNKN